MASTERTPLLTTTPESAGTLRKAVYSFVEGKHWGGRLYEKLTIILIFVNVISFVLSTDATIAASATKTFDGIEVTTVIVFTLDYIMRLYSVVEVRDSAGNAVYRGVLGRLRFAATDFFAIVDLLSILPFYIDLLIPEDLPATQFIRIFRLFRMMRVEGRYMEAFTTFDDIFRENKHLLAASGFVGVTTWIILSSFFWLAERDNPEMIWTYPSCYNPYGSEEDDDGGGSSDMPYCPNRYQSITSSAYFCLLNLFGEFPLISQHTPWGRVIGAFTAVFAVAVFGVPTGVFGSGFEDMIRRRKEAEAEAAAAAPADGGNGTLPGPGDGRGAAGSEGLVINGRDATAPPSKATGSSALKCLLEGASSAGRAYERLLFAVVILSVAAFMASTVPVLERNGTAATKAVLAWTEIACVSVLSVDYVLRLTQAWEAGGLHACFAYLISFYGVVDLLSVVPTFAGLAVFGSINVLNPSNKMVVARALRLVRMLKVERYTKAFSVMDDVLRENADVLVVSGFAAVVLLIFASTLMYYTEKYNPDPDVAAFYTSVPAAMWITMLNLSGEAPLCDYTVGGKIITAIVGCFAVGVFAVPVGLIGAGYESWISEIPDDEEVVASASAAAAAEELAQERGTRQPTSARHLTGSNSSFRDRLYAFCEGRTPGGRYFEALVMLAIVVSVTAAVVQTVASICPSEAECPAVFDWVELVAVLFFTVEYALRLYAAPSNPAYAGMSPWAAYFFHIVSLYAIIDWLATFPYYLSFVSSEVDKYDDYLRLLRLLRLLKMDKYVPSISLIDDVFRAKHRGLLVSGAASGTLWVAFAAALYLAERKDGTQVDCLTEAQRFKSVPNSLQYDLILLTGDYPLIDFTIWGRLINVLQIVVAVGVVAVPSGLIAGGFTEILEQSREERHAKRREAAVLLQRQARGFLARRQFLLVVHGVQELEAKRRERAQAAEEAERGLRPMLRWEHRAYAFVTGKTRAGAYSRVFVVLLIVANVVAVIVESEPGNDDDATQQAIFDAFEAFSVAVFTADILLRLFSAPLSSQYEFSRVGYVISFFGIVDIGSVLPWYVQMALTSSGTEFDASPFRVVRLFRLLQLEHFVQAFTLLDDVYRSCKDVLAATGLLALVVWLGSACLFYLFERHNDCMEGAFDSIPTAMYYVAVMLGGEWGVIDFTLPGKVLCCVLCVVGICLFSIPVGTLFESFADVLGEAKEEESAPTQAGKATKDAAAAAAK